MVHELYKVTAFQIIGPYRLRIEFDDDTAREIDFEPILYGKIYGPLRNLELFNQVQLDSAAHTLVWPNDADFDPETLRNWPLYRDAWIKAAHSLGREEKVSAASGRESLRPF